MENQPKLPDPQQEVVDALVKTWALYPSLRLGQLLSHAADAAVGQPGSLAVLPILDDMSMIDALSALRAQMGHPDPQ